MVKEKDPILQRAPHERRSDGDIVRTRVQAPGRVIVDDDHRRCVQALRLGQGEVHRKRDMVTFFLTRHHAADHAASAVEEQEQTMFVTQTGQRAREMRPDPEQA